MSKETTPRTLPQQEKTRLTVLNSNKGDLIKFSSVFLVIYLLPTCMCLILLCLSLFSCMSVCLGEDTVPLVRELFRHTLIATRICGQIASCINMIGKGRRFCFFKKSSDSVVNSVSVD